MSAKQAAGQISKADTMRQLLRAGEWNSHALAVAAEAEPSAAWRLIDAELKRGNVAMVGKQKKGGAKLYTWAGDDDLITMAIRAAEYLREHATDPLGQSLAGHLMRLSGATTVAASSSSRADSLPSHSRRSAS